MIAFETEIRIRRDVDDVFAFVAEPQNFPRWNSAVTAVRALGARGGVTTYAMERRLPAGHAVNELEVVAHEPPREFTIRTTSGPTPFRYAYRFSAEGDETLVRLDAQVDLGGIARLVPQLAAKAVRNGVDENLASLKAILEDGWAWPPRSSPRSSAAIRSPAG